MLFNSFLKAAKPTSKTQILHRFPVSNPPQIPPKLSKLQAKDCLDKKLIDNRPKYLHSFLTHFLQISPLPLPFAFGFGLRMKQVESEPVSETEYEQDSRTLARA